MSPISQPHDHEPGIPSQSELTISLDNRQATCSMWIRLCQTRPSKCPTLRYPEVERSVDKWTGYLSTATFVRIRTCLLHVYVSLHLGGCRIPEARCQNAQPLEVRCCPWPPGTQESSNPCRQIGLSPCPDLVLMRHRSHDPVNQTLWLLITESHRAATVLPACHPKPVVGTG